jgi:nucleotide-binding universal stress UspA family protein
MYSRILVAVDGSHTSELALQHAINLAKQLGACLRIVHVVDESNAVNWDAEFSDPTEIWTALALNGRQILDRANTAATEADINVDTRLIEVNNPGRRIAEVIKEEADAWQADLIVAGTHGRRGLSHVFLGSVAEGIARIANQPVLLVREK